MFEKIFTYLSCLFIIAVAVSCYFYIYRADDEKLKASRRWVMFLPNLVSTLGVIGTFVGISIGLWHFNPHELSQSVNLLLEGLKTAFFTSLCGMFGSLILNRLISRRLDAIKEEPNNDLVEAIKRASEPLLKELQEIKAINNSIKSNTECVDTLNDTTQEILSLINEINEKVQGDVQSEQGGDIDSLRSDIEKLRALLFTVTEAVVSKCDNVD